MKKIIFIFIYFYYFLLFSIDNPKDPVITKLDNKNNNFVSIEYKKENGYFTKASIENFKNFYLTNLIWDGNKRGDQKIYSEFIKSINIKGYTQKKIKRDNLSIVYYFPYLYDIELKNGTKLTNVMGRIREIESFTVYNEIGKEKCYTYFVRYWLEDKKMFFHNKSTNYNEKPDVPDNTVIYIEFK